MADATLSTEIPRRTISRNGFFVQNSLPDREFPSTATA